MAMIVLMVVFASVIFLGVGAPGHRLWRRVGGMGREDEGGHALIFAPADDRLAGTTLAARPRPPSADGDHIESHVPERDQNVISRGRGVLRSPAFHR